MEYLTIEEKSSLTGYLVLLDDKIKTCQLLGMSSEHWENQKAIFQNAYDKITNDMKNDMSLKIKIEKIIEELKK